jgi:hypothetical protein
MPEICLHSREKTHRQKQKTLVLKRTEVEVYKLTVYKKSQSTLPKEPEPFHWRSLVGKVGIGQVQMEVQIHKSTFMDQDREETEILIQL